jgi:hypothetical protein
MRPFRLIAGSSQVRLDSSGGPDGIAGRNDLQIEARFGVRQDLDQEERRMHANFLYGLVLENITGAMISLRR